jgi:hypothetical protein
MFIPYCINHIFHNICHYKLLCHRLTKINLFYFSIKDKSKICKDFKIIKLSSRRRNIKFSIKLLLIIFSANWGFSFIIEILKNLFIIDIISIKIFSIISISFSLCFDLASFSRMLSKKFRVFSLNNSFCKFLLRDKRRIV